MTNFNLVPPDVNVLKIKGAGSTSMLIAQTAWNELGKELRSRAEEWSGQITATEELFKGGAANTFIDRAEGYQIWLRSHAATAFRTAEYLGEAMQAYDTAVRSMVPYTAVAMNRSILLGMKAANLVGNFSGKIAELESEYQVMWAQNAAAMNTYRSAIFDLTGLVQQDSILAAPQIIPPSNQRLPDHNNKLHLDYESEADPTGEGKREESGHVSEEEGMGGKGMGDNDLAQK